MLVHGWVLLAGSFYLSPFLCKFLAVPGCLLFVAVCVYLWFPHPQKNVTSLSFLTFVFLFVPLYTSSLDPAVFPSGCCSSALELACWKCQKLAFSPCRVTVCPWSPQCTFCLLTRIMLALTCSCESCVIAEETLVSLNSVTAPCCHSKFNRRVLIG